MEATPPLVTPLRGHEAQPFPDYRRLVPGGSSGGSAASVAAGSCFAAVGSDTGGSVRQPAAFCGVVGVKPTYGRVSRYGLIAYASSLDTPGVLARTVRDAGIVLDAMAGPDERDSTCIQQRPPPGGFMAGLEGGLPSLKGLTVGVPSEFRVEELEEGVVAAWEEGVGMLREAGAEVRVVSIPSVPLALPAYFVIACAEASSNLAR
jgi:aspartyl-tRNA(Asn)/glutamyl-tRNA(Gln) amidotransferase subunit A